MGGAPARRYAMSSAKNAAPTPAQPPVARTSARRRSTCNNESREGDRIGNAFSECRHDNNPVSATQLSTIASFAVTPAYRAGSIRPYEATPRAGSPVIQTRAPSRLRNAGGGLEIRTRAPDAGTSQVTPFSIRNVPSMAGAPSTVRTTNCVASREVPESVPDTQTSAPAVRPIMVASGPVISTCLPPPTGASIVCLSRSVPLTEMIPRAVSDRGWPVGLIFVFLPTPASALPDFLFAGSDADTAPGETAGGDLRAVSEVEATVGVWPTESDRVESDLAVDRPQAADSAISAIIDRFLISVSEMSGRRSAGVCIAPGPLVNSMLHLSLA